MRKTGALLLLLLVLAVTANCAKQDGAPAEDTREVLAKASETTALKQEAEGGQESKVDAAGTGQPRIAFDQKNFDFGTVEAGEKVEHIYTFRNTGDGTLLIHKVRSG
jgi:hypothetical protein